MREAATPDPDGAPTATTRPHALRLSARPGGPAGRPGRRGCLARVAAALAVASPATGCASVGATPPAVGVERVELRGLGLLDQSLGVTLCVSNPDDAELAFRRVTVALDVAGAPLAASASEAPVRLPPRSSALVPFAVATTTRNLAPQLLDVLLAGGVEYRLRGAVQFGGAPAIAVPFDRSGRFGPLDAGRELLAVGRGVLADAAAPGGSRCAAAAPP